MDASVFCFVARELATRIRGMRVEKVFAPLPETWTISFGRAGYLVLCTGKPTPFLYLSTHKPENPHNPAGRAMWLRKRLRDRRVLDLVADWPRRRLALELSAGEGRWLILDLAADPLLTDSLAPEFGVEPPWPDLGRILSEDGLWREYPHLTPPLRHHLASVSPDAAESLLQSIKTGTVSAFYHGLDHRGRPQVRLWPMDGAAACGSVLEVAEKAHGQTLATRALDHAGTDGAAARNIRRIERALARVEEDQARLLAMSDQRRGGLLLQAQLHCLDKNARMGTVLVADESGEEVALALDPGLTVRENMARIFARAAKGERGLGIVAARAQALRRELAAARAGRSLPAPPLPGLVARTPAPSPLPAKYRKLKVALYRSSDGYLIIRGRSAQANHQLLTQAASPFDYWLHAHGGPGAHVIVKRDFPTQEIPEQTIQEAAALAALASHLKMSDRGDVLLCMVKDVRPIKGAALGMVGVDKVLRTVRPSIDPGLEEKLRFETER
jgi:predicted ribosome quality control (RQC) complex YloA/Tae2 family protein